MFREITEEELSFSLKTEDQGIKTKVPTFPTSPGPSPGCVKIKLVKFITYILIIDIFSILLQFISNRIFSYSFYTSPEVGFYLTVVSRLSKTFCILDVTKNGFSKTSSFVKRITKYPILFKVSVRNLSFSFCCK